MARLTWGAPDERVFAAGLDRGVLYPRVGEAVPWNGLKAVTETPNAGVPASFYQDGLKYLHEPVREDASVSLTAFGAPAVFDQHVGVRTNNRGLKYTGQPRTPFALSYRTLLGDAVLGLEAGYQLHFWPQLVVDLSEETRTTSSATPEVSEFTWEMKALKGLYSQEHYVLDSRTTSAIMLEQFQLISYGDTEQSIAPRIPTEMEMALIAQGGAG